MQPLDLQPVAVPRAEGFGEIVAAAVPRLRIFGKTFGRVLAVSMASVKVLSKSLAGDDKQKPDTLQIQCVGQQSNAFQL